MINMKIKNYFSAFFKSVWEKTILRDAKEMGARLIQ